MRWDALDTDVYKVASIYDMWTAGDVQGAIDMHYRLLPLNDVLFRDTNPVPMKAALGMMGKVEPIVRPPLGAPSEELTNIVRETLKMYDLV